MEPPRPDYPIDLVFAEQIANAVRMTIRGCDLYCFLDHEPPT